MWWQIVLAILAALLLPLLIPIGVRFVYDLKGPVVRVLIGPFWYTVYPFKKKEKKKKPKKETPREKEGKKQKAKEPVKIGGLLQDFQPLVEPTLDFFSAFKRKLRIKRLDFDLVLAGDDPCDLALNYGRAWIALGNLMPLLENVFVIKKRDLNISCDYMADSTRVYVRADITITIGRGLWVLAAYGSPVLCKFLKIYNMRKGGNKHESESS